MLSLKTRRSISTRRPQLIIEQFRSDWQCGSFRNRRQVGLWGYSSEHCQVIRLVLGRRSQVCDYLWTSVLTRHGRDYTTRITNHLGTGGQGRGIRSSQKPRKRIQRGEVRAALVCGREGCRAGPAPLGCWLAAPVCTGLVQLHSTCTPCTVSCTWFFWKERKHFFVPESSSMASSLNAAFQQAAASRPVSAPEELNFQLPSISFGLRLH